SASCRLTHCLLSVIIIILSLPEKFAILGPGHPVITTVGEELLLTCQLSPWMNASSFTVKWYRAEPNAVVHIYQNSADVTGEQDPGYKGRTELVKNELMDGKVSLKLKGIRVSDQGFYKCFVASPLWFDESPIEVIVAGIGRDPLIYVDKYENKGVKLSCKSSGWYPKPEVTWKDANNQSVRSETEVIEERNDGLFEVTSNIVTEEPSHKFTCHIKNSVTQIVQESSLLIGGDFFTGISDWLALTLLLLVQILATICISYWYWKRKKKSIKRDWEIKMELKEFSFSPKMTVRQCWPSKTDFLNLKRYSAFFFFWSVAILHREGKKVIKEIKCCIKELKIPQSQIFSSVFCFSLPLVHVTSPDLILVSFIEFLDAQNYSSSLYGKINTGLSKKRTSWLYSPSSKCTSSKVIFCSLYKQIKVLMRLGNLVNITRYVVGELLASIYFVTWLSRQWVGSHIELWISVPPTVILFPLRADITLDQQTAHPELIVSENCKTVAYCSNLALENSKRYSFTCVLGSDGFVSWRHYWEVKVEDKLKWIVGVARESADKKVGITVSPACGYWALCLRNGTDYRALTSPSIKLTLSVKPSKIGVYLDYEGGRVSFYNVDDKSLIYMFEDKFTEKMFPFFN
uniref:Butyrophilin subfamily 1 member A1 n=1 Tax=Latimeria chalumnae TaxID=7897 RepID=H3AVF7_LATCH